MDDSWTTATVTLRGKRYSEAVRNWSILATDLHRTLQRELVRNAIDFEGLLNHADGVVPLKAFRILGDEDLRLIDSMSAHNHAVVFDRCFCFEITNQRPSVIVRWLVSLYNVALSHHLAAFFGPSEASKKAIRKAEQLYNVCIQLLLRSLQTNIHPNLHLLLMASMNNRGQILHHLCECSEAAEDTSIVALCLNLFLGSTQENIVGPEIATIGRRARIDHDSLAFFLQFCILPDFLLQPKLSAAA